jgi:hypothetical protein
MCRLKLTPIAVMTITPERVRVAAGGAEVVAEARYFPYFA